jgi:hypothetical protein
VHLFSFVNKPPPLLRQLQAFIDETDFWLEVEVLAKLLEPLALAVMAIQRRTSNLANMLRYHIMIAHVLTSATYMDASTASTPSTSAGARCDHAVGLKVT